MAITILTAPKTVAPVYNRNYIRLIDSNATLSGYKYYVTLSKKASSSESFIEIGKFAYFPNADGILEFDPMPILSNYMNNSSYDYEIVSWDYKPQMLEYKIVVSRVFDGETETGIYYSAILYTFDAALSQSEMDNLTTLTDELKVEAGTTADGYLYSTTFTDNQFMDGAVGFTGMAGHKFKVGDEIFIAQSPGFTHAGYEGVTTILAVTDNTIKIDKGWEGTTPAEGGIVSINILSNSTNRYLSNVNTNLSLSIADYYAGDLFLNFPDEALISNLKFGLQLQNNTGGYVYLTSTDIPTGLTAIEKRIASHGIGPKNIEAGTWKDEATGATISGEALFTTYDFNSYKAYLLDSDFSQNYNFGNLYNWYAVNSGKLAPTGYRIHSTTDLSTLRTYLGGTAAAGAIKSTRTSTTTPTWESPNTGAANLYSMNILAGGYRLGNYGNYYADRYSTFFWTTDSVLASNAGYFSLSHNSSNFSNSNIDKRYGLSVRFMRDATVPEQALVDGTYLENVLDASGYYYKMIKIGTQVWANQNLMTTKYNDDTDIPNVTATNDWTALSTAAYCTFANAALSTYEDPTFNYTIDDTKRLLTKPVQVDFCRSIQIKNTKGFDRIWLVYKSKWGGWSYLSFNMKKAIKQNMSSVTYNRRPKYNETYKSRGTTVISNNVSQIYTLNTDWVSTYEWEFYEDLFASPQVYMLRTSINGVVNTLNPFEPCVIKTTSTPLFSPNNDKLFSYSIEIETANGKKTQRN